MAFTRCDASSGLSFSKRHISLCKVIKAAAACLDIWVKGLRLLVSHTTTYLCSSLLQIVGGPSLTVAVLLFVMMFLQVKWNRSLLDISKSIPPFPAWLCSLLPALERIVEFSIHELCKTIRAKLSMYYVLRSIFCFRLS